MKKLRPYSVRQVGQAKDEPGRFETVSAVMHRATKRIRETRKAYHVMNWETVLSTFEPKDLEHG